MVKNGAPTQLSKLLELLEDHGVMDTQIANHVKIDAHKMECTKAMCFYHKDTHSLCTLPSCFLWAFAFQYLATSSAIERPLVVCLVARCSYHPRPLFAKLGFSRRLPSMVLPSRGCLLRDVICSMLSFLKKPLNFLLYFARSDWLI